MNAGEYKYTDTETNCKVKNWQLEHSRRANQNNSNLDYELLRRNVDNQYQLKMCRPIGNFIPCHSIYGNLSYAIANWIPMHGIYQWDFLRQQKAKKQKPVMLTDMSSVRKEPITEALKMALVDRVNLSVKVNEMMQVLCLVWQSKHRRIRHLSATVW